MKQPVEETIEKLEKGINKLVDLNHTDHYFIQQEIIGMFTAIQDYLKWKQEPMMERMSPKGTHPIDPLGDYRNENH